jgi:hypothetical protein
MRNTKSAKKNTIITILAVAVVVISLLAVYFYNISRSAQVGSKDATQQEVKNLIAEVGKLMVLPDGEEPTVATVSDPEKLRDQEFFAKASAGDKVLVYRQAGRAILYSVALNKILEVAPITGNQSATSSR